MGAIHKSTYLPSCTAVFTLNPNKNSNNNSYLQNKTITHPKSQISSDIQTEISSALFWIPKNPYNKTDAVSPLGLEQQNLWKKYFTNSET